jgi:hypothetical protein
MRCCFSSQRKADEVNGHENQITDLCFHSKQIKFASFEAMQIYICAKPPQDKLLQT